MLPINDPAPPPPVYARPPVNNNTHRYGVGDVLRFVQPGWVHEPAIPGGQRTREGTVARIYQERIENDDVLVYRIVFTLMNGQQRSRVYEAKPLDDDDEEGGDGAGGDTAVSQQPKGKKRKVVLDDDDDDDE